MERSWSYENTLKGRKAPIRFSVLHPLRFNVSPPLAKGDIALLAPNPVFCRCRDAKRALVRPFAVTLRSFTHDNHDAGFIHKPALNSIGRQFPLFCDSVNRKHFFIHSRRSQKRTNGIFRLIYLLSFRLKIFSAPLT